ncbi:transmembrane protein 94-like [Ylistrum balloti]|uniref:transmembrane protein 94-like n=1 Tax=Ylistrum balloti TaxID=509963 RepID=UPI0029058E6B|nr:transmembrane protein 94-like [Ylistrum balloti]
MTEGYSTREALSVLYDELTAEVDKYEDETKHKKWRSYLSLFHHAHIKSAFHWTSLLLLLGLCIALFVAFIISNVNDEDVSGRGWWMAEVVVILLTVTTNICFNIWNGKQAHEELIYVTRLSLSKLEECIDNNTWNNSNYPTLHAPISPCVSLQWTIRDKEVVNLPTTLLVQGDIILLRPGQEAPAECREVEESNEGQDTFLKMGDVYSPQGEDYTEEIKGPHGKSPLTSKQFILLETPFIKHIRLILEDSTRRPVSNTEKVRYIICSKWLEHRILPVVLILVLITNVLRLVYLKGHSGHWAEMILVLPSHTLLPLLPLLFPLAWRLLNFYGQARVFTVFSVAKDTKVTCEDSFSTNSTISVDEARVDMDWTLVRDWFWLVLSGRAPAPTRRVNISHILGSVTSLCCVDKKGLLSWPNPSAEKVFFLSSHDKGNPTIDISSTDNDKKKEGNDTKPALVKAYESPSHVEVLDLTHDSKNVFGLRFDDPTWKNHLNSLKPLGLNILLNTCNIKTVEWYTQFTDHVASEALENEETVAVVNRRCLCELARQIGFSDKAMDIFTLERILGMYKHVHPDESAKERLHRAKSFIQHKIPMPNLVSVVVREKASGLGQVLSQGTADLLLACCSDYWDGEDVSVLTESDRKKILDFYHRTSMASYCTAFSYRPLTQHISPHLDNLYIQLSHGGNVIFNSCSETQRDSNTDSNTDLVHETRLLSDSSRAFSVDSLFDTTSISSIEDIPGCCQAQNNQIFIGMVSMQYQARQEVVQLIEKLEVACIRFVHFSQENEVRSRVFAEKMGLEAGWNCHISMLSDPALKGETAASSAADLPHRMSRYSSRNSSDTVAKDTNMVSSTYKHSQDSMHSRCQSAPSIVNLNSSQVRFEMTTDTSSSEPRSPRVYIGERTPLTTDGEDEEEVLFTNTELSKSYSSQCNTNQDLDNITDIESRHASSYFTENTDSLTGALDNRAKLPRGIENIRPHLQTVDNVPLLVNLFTDCTTHTTQEMMKIMQEFGEVVMCVGSSNNINNTAIFLQADCSLALEPLYPQVCAVDSLMTKPWKEDQLTPMQLASTLISIPCPLTFRKEDNISLIKLIAEARSFLMSSRNCFYLMLCYHLSLSLVQLLGSMVLLPPVLASQHLLWILFIVIPFLSLSMMGLPVDPRVMNNATTHNSEYITKDVVQQFLLYFVTRFVPAGLVCLLCYGLTLHSFCAGDHTPQPSCAIFAFGANSSSQLWYDKYSGGLVLAQNVFTFYLVFYFVVISVSFVHWSDHIWQQNPLTNRLWVCTVLLLICGQVVLFVCDMSIRGAGQHRLMSLGSVHPAVWGIGFSFPLVILFINELVKRHEVKLYSRYQKRTRLHFGTKLGMNSPF